MTTKQMKALSFACQSAEEAEYMMEKITRLLAQCDTLSAMGADREWVQTRRADLMHEAARAKTVLAHSREQCARFEEILCGCPDGQTEQILRLRFQRHYSWQNIALRLGGGNTGEGVRKRAARYLAAVDEACKTVSRN